MSGHETQYERIPRYIQNQLAGEELEEFQAHLATCPACAAEFKEEQALSALLRKSAPLYQAPADFAERMRELLAKPQPAVAETPLPAAPAIGWRFPRLPLLFKRWGVWVPAVVTVVLCLLFVPNLVRQARADSYVNTAVSNYHQVSEGRLSFGIQSTSSKELSAWVADRVPFEFQLPTAGNKKQKDPAYHLVGASLIRVKDHPAVLVTYKKDAETIVLLVAPDQYATVAGGEQIQHEDLLFHYFVVDSTTVVTWGVHGLSYALVSSRSSSQQGLKPCLVCHQDMTDRRYFQLAHHR